MRCILLTIRPSGTSNSPSTPGAYQHRRTVVNFFIVGLVLFVIVKLITAAEAAKVAAAEAEKTAATEEKKKTEKECPSCLEMVKANAKVRLFLRSGFSNVKAGEVIAESDLVVLATDLQVLHAGSAQLDPFTVLPSLDTRWTPRFFSLTCRFVSSSTPPLLEIYTQFNNIDFLDSATNLNQLALVQTFPSPLYPALHLQTPTAGAVFEHIAFAEHFAAFPTHGLIG